ncbi:DUF3106 domain-containing protein [Sediminibacterium roseum]|uniref:DUF3106 domain-containing protein n=1 Tax=Sediminibacterium roseum TaxID=1978412 RepID=A0ABW9ZNV2_9BACT|nr:DUF3106 domain-containing protein [Sediminibacterium roseum]NCI48761.1 DUF3106 domain-containing protein [Sediminibacterium roseum]
MKFWIKKIIGFILCFLLIAALLSWIVMSLWNCVLVAVLGVSVISFWQAAGILLLSKILFGGFHKSGHWGRKREWREKWAEKMKNMSPEEREKIKQEWRNRCNMWGKKES